MKKNIVYCLIVFSSFLLSCRENHEKLEVPKILEKKKKNIDFEVVFPDTVYVNKEYKGKIFYKSILDTITTSFDDEDKKRYTILYVKILQNYSYNDFEFSSFKKSSELQYGASNNNEIPFYRIEFDSVGVFYINGVIEDFVYINLKQNDENGKPLRRVVEVQEELLHKVVVIPEPIIND